MDEERWDEVYLTFEGPVFDAALAAGVMDEGGPVLAVEPVTVWLARIDAFRTRQPPMTAAGVDREACDLLRLLTDTDAAVDPEPVRGWLPRSQALLGQNLGESIDLHEVAAAVGLTFETWRKRFRAETGTAPARYRALRRMEAAAEALRLSTLSHREIAASLGFTDAQHMAKQFRTIRGTTPTEVRRDLG